MAKQTQITRFVDRRDTPDKDRDRS
jgi:hypothetical protein